MNKNSVGYFSLFVCLSMLILCPNTLAGEVNQGEELFFVYSPAAMPSDIHVWTTFWMGEREVAIVGAAPGQEGTIAALGEKYGRIEEPASGKKIFIVSSRRGIDPALLDRYSTVLLCDMYIALVETDQMSADILVSEGMSIKAVRPAARFKGVIPELTSRQTSALPDPIVQEVIDFVEQADVYNWIGNLSGENSVTIGGSPYTILTRNSYQTASIEKATQYCHEYFKGQGLSVTYQNFSAGIYSCRNVVAVQPGSVNPGNIYVICGHLDDMPNAAIAPGADDNASGSTAVLLAASILSRYSFENTIRYVLFTGEEQGLDGSYHYVQQCVGEGDNILGALNFDMISYDGDLDGRAEVYCGTMASSGALGDVFIDTISTYSLALSPVKFTSNVGWSDHASFWDAGYPAIVGIEDTGTDFNPYYHTPNDKRIHCNIPYATNFAKAAVGTAARLAAPIPTITPKPTMTPKPTPAPTKPPSLVIEASPESPTPGERFTLGLDIQGNILRPFDFYLVADTPYGVYTVALDGCFIQGITPLYSSVPFLQGPKSATVYDNVTVPSWRSGAYTFYSAAVEAGKIPPVSTLSGLTSSTPYVIALGRAQIELQ